MYSVPAAKTILQSQQKKKLRQKKQTAQAQVQKIVLPAQVQKIVLPAQVQMIAGPMCSKQWKAIGKEAVYATMADITHLAKQNIRHIAIVKVAQNPTFLN
jgi:hypothetical protein